MFEIHSGYDGCLDNRVTSVESGGSQNILTILEDGNMRMLRGVLNHELPRQDKQGTCRDREAPLKTRLGLNDGLVS